VEEYLRLQGRYAHLFDSEGNPARPDIIAALQRIADRNIARYGLLEREEASP
jgi:pyruvate ferredoxin oxidoreductase beta subunit